MELLSTSHPRAMRAAPGRFRRQGQTPKERLANALLAAALTAIWSFSAQADSNACEREMVSAAARHGVPLQVLYSVGLTESGVRGHLNPFDIDVDGRPISANSLSDAISRVESEQAHGAKFIDVGCMQINVRFHGSHFASLAQMFDPARNVDYAAGYLRQLKDQVGTWTLAVARYNAGPANQVAEVRYVCSVVRGLVASGFGRRTPSADALCKDQGR